MKWFAATLIGFVLIGCGDTTTDDDTVEPVACIESLFCCEYTCTTQAVMDERGPDPCDCETDPEPPMGTCESVDGQCVFVE